MLDKKSVRTKSLRINAFDPPLEFNLNKDNQILDKGAYFGEMYYLPYYHQNSWFSDNEIVTDKYTIYSFEILDTEVDLFPELKNVKTLNVLVDNLGFVYGDTSSEPIDINSIKERFRTQNNIGINTKVGEMRNDNK